MRRAFLDVETTGVDPYNDRIVEIAIGLIGESEADFFVSLVNPARPIPSQATETHGITDADVEDAPSFAEIAAKVQGLVAGSTLVTYNGMRFDTILVDRELRRAGERGLDRDDRGRIVHPEIDLFALWKNAQPRTLKTAVALFADRELEGAHSAGADTAVLPDVLEGMIDAFGLDPDDEPALRELSRPSWLVDRDGKFRRRDDGRIVFAFGKNRDELASSDPGYLEWMIGADFSPETKSWAADLLAGSAL